MTSQEAKQVQIGSRVRDPYYRRDLCVVGISIKGSPNFRPYFELVDPSFDPPRYVGLISYVQLIPTAESGPAAGRWLE